jgi:uncharacterized protein
MDGEALRYVVERLVAAVHPRRIVLFGSRARDDARDDSDYDIAVIAEIGGAWWELGIVAQRALRGIGLPLELLILTPAEYEARRRVPGSIAWEIDREGRTLYDADRAPAA